MNPNPADPVTILTRSFDRPKLADELLDRVLTGAERKRLDGFVRFRRTTTAATYWRTVCKCVTDGWFASCGDRLDVLMTAAAGLRPGDAELRRWLRPADAPAARGARGVHMLYHGNVGIDRLVETTRRCAAELGLPLAPTRGVGFPDWHHLECAGDGTPADGHLLALRVAAEFDAPAERFVVWPLEFRDYYVVRVPVAVNGREFVADAIPASMTVGVLELIAWRAAGFELPPRSLPAPYAALAAGPLPQLPPAHPSP